MSATLKRTQAKQHPRPLMTPANKTAIAEKQPFWLEDGSLVIPPDKLARFSAEKDPNDGAKQLRLLIEAEYDREVTDHVPVEWPASVIIATEVHEPAIMELLLTDVRMNAEHIAPVDAETILGNVRVATCGQGGIGLVIPDASGKAIAVSILIPMQWWWSKSWYYQEMVTFVHPEHRRSRHVHDLMAAQQWMTDRASSSGNRIYLLCGVLGMNRVHAKVIMLRRKMRQVGWAFLYPSPFGSRGVT